MTSISAFLQYHQDYGSKEEGDEYVFSIVWYFGLKFCILWFGEKGEKEDGRA